MVGLANACASAEGDLDGALRAWREELGPRWVSDDPGALSQAETATFLTTQRIAALIRPGTRREVQACARIASAHSVPVYPISGGKNWGYGSRVPAEDGCVLLDLSRLNRITDYDERLAYVRVEAGVTFHQLFRFLRDRGSRLMLNVTMGTGQGSVIGNALERGYGRTPYGDRFAHVCNLEIVLASGEVVHTGSGRFGGAAAAEVDRWGVGPSLDGLFAQSNLGIVTAMTVWLTPIPKYLQVCSFAVDDEAGLERMVDALQRVKLTGLIQSIPSIQNAHRRLADSGKRSRRVGEVLEDPVEGIPAWNGSVEVHAAEEEIGRAVRSALISALRRSVDRLEFHDVSGAAVYDLYASSTSRGHLEPFLPRNMKLPWFFGVPSESGVMTAYWARTAPVPENLDPDRDGCGLIWCNAAVPFKGAHVRAALEIMRAELELCHFDPLLSVSGISERAAYCLAAIAFDRSQAGADERALACRRSMMARLSTAGYYPYRLGIDCMDGLPASRDASDALLRTLKSALDPRGVLAPGRYISSQSSIRSVLLSQPGRDRNKGEDES